MRATAVVTLMLAAAWSGALAGTAARAQTARSIWDGVFADAQATRGQARYKASCETCHSDDLLGGSGPALVGEAFLQRWNGSSVNDMLVTLRQTMPQDSPDSLGTPGYVDVIAFLLKSNSAPAGAAELPADAGVLQAIKVTDRTPAR